MLTTAGSREQAQRAAQTRGAQAEQRQLPASSRLTPASLLQNHHPVSEENLIFLKVISIHPSSTVLQNREQNEGVGVLQTQTPLVQLRVKVGPAAGEPARGDSAPRDGAAGAQGVAARARGNPHHARTALLCRALALQAESSPVPESAARTQHLPQTTGAAHGPPLGVPTLDFPVFAGHFAMPLCE